MQLGPEVSAAQLEIFRTAIETLSEGVVLQDAHGGMVACNISAERILAMSIEQMRGTRVMDTGWQAVREDGTDFPVDERPPAVVRRTSGPVSGVVMGIRDHGGRVCWMEVNARPVWRDGEPRALAGVVVTMRDVSARRIAEQQRDKFFSVSRDMLAVLGFDGRLLQLNSVWSTALGYRVEDMVGRRYEEFVHPADVAHTQAELDDLCDGQPVGQFENRWRTADGGWRWLLWSSTAAPEERLLYAAAQDITELKATQARLEGLVRQNEMLLDTSADGIYGMDRDGRCTFVNQAAARMTGFEPAEWLGQSLHALIHHSRHDGSPFPEALCPLRSLLLQGTGSVLVGDTFWRRDGTSFAVELSASPITADGETTGAVVLFRDVQQREAIERMKDELVSVVSHELRTPLTSMRGALGMLTSGLMGEIGDKAARMLQIAVANTDRMIRLVSDMLDLERISSGLATLRPTPVPVTGLLDAAVDVVRPEADRCDIMLQVTGLDRTVYVDSARIVQMLGNLLSNAIKFSPPGTTVSLSACEADGRLRLTVQDRGRGIPSNMLRQIFARFQQVDASDSRDRGGTGLGLAICQAIAMQHRGRIWAESAPGEGATFHVLLPWGQGGPGAR